MQEALKMNINHIGDKLLSTVESHASIIGAGALLMSRTTALQEEIGLILRGNVHAPDLGWLLPQIGNTQAYRTAGLALIAGALAEDIHNPLIAKMGSATTKVATAYLITGIAENILWSCTHSAYPAGFIPNTADKGKIITNSERGY